MPAYEFTEDWFSHNEAVWDELFDEYQPRRFVEIGSFEGRSASFVIDRIGQSAPVEIHCIDTWQGGVEHREIAMSEVEQRFDRNLALARRLAEHPVRLYKYKQHSSDALARLIANGGRDRFDFIYIDGSHQAPDVLADAVLSFELLKPGGIMTFDDYAWSFGDDDFYQLPKPAIDAFININRRRLTILLKPLYQLYVRKNPE